MTTTTPTAPPGVVVKPMDDGAPVVRGTTDPETARAALAAWAPDGLGLTPGEEVAQWIAARHVIRAGYFRWTPCSPTTCWDGGTHAGHLAYCDQPGPGVWQGVWFE